MRYYRRADAISTAPFGDELVALNSAGDAYFNFNATSRRVWEMLAEPQHFDTLCARLMAEFDVDEATCRAELSALLGQLEAEGLVAA